MGKGSKEDRKPKKAAEKKPNASAPSLKGLPAGPVKAGAPAKKK